MVRDSVLDLNYMVVDLETENHKTHRRMGNPFIKENFIVARGWKVKGDKRCSWQYFENKTEKHTLHIPANVDILIGHNIKYDLLYEWKSESLRQFFKRGGMIWDTQYAEYLINGQIQKYQMVAMDDIAEKYGGRVKLNEVKALWEAGVKTSEIDPDLLINYLVGTEEEKRDSGDIGNTEKIYLGQLKKAITKGMIPMIQARMDGLLCTTEMEHNGLKIDVATAVAQATKLEDELEAMLPKLNTYIPKDLPPELDFNWGSRTHISAIIFGGTVKYKKKVPKRDKDNQIVYAYDKQDWPLFHGEFIDPDGCDFDEEAGLYTFTANGTEVYYQDQVASGKNKGMPKFKKVKVQTVPRMVYKPHFYKFKGYTQPNPLWATKNLDAAERPVYSVDADTVEELGYLNIPFLKDYARKSAIEKDLSTYYLAYDEKKKVPVGMMCCILADTHIVHHSLNHTVTVTTRLSSSDPNLQNIPKAGKSEVKKMFVSRFDDGVMMEVDYSQLEVIIQAMLSGDPQMCEDVRNAVDFHCKRVSAWKKITYEEALYRCKNENFPQFKEWKEHRTNAKTFSFQRAYGAGNKKIATYTGMPIEEVDTLALAEDALYPYVNKFNEKVAAEVERTARPFKDITGKVFRRGTYTTPDGTRYSFRTYDSFAWQKKRGITDTFKPTEMKNYPVQGFGGYVVQVALGKLWRMFVANDNYKGKALLCNTVHDSVWADCKDNIKEQVGRDMRKVMEAIPQYLHELHGMDVQVPFPVEVETGLNLYDKQVLHL